MDFQFLAFPSLSGTPMMQMLDLLKLFQRLFILSSFFWILFYSTCSVLLLFASLCSKSLIWFLASSTLLLFPCKLFFISISVSFVSDWVFFLHLRSSLGSLSVLIYPIFLTLHLIDYQSPFHLALFLEFWSTLSFGPCFFVSSFWQPPRVYFYVLGSAALTPCLDSVASCSTCPV